MRRSGSSRSISFRACSAVTLGVIVLGGVDPRHVGPADGVAGLTMLSRLLGRLAIDPSTWTPTPEVAFHALIALAYPGLCLRKLENVCARRMGGRLAGILLLVPRRIASVSGRCSRSCVTAMRSRSRWWNQRP